MALAVVDGIRSVDLGVSDLASREGFYKDVWRLLPVIRTQTSTYLRGASPHHHLVGLHIWDQPQLLRIDLTTANRTAIDVIHDGLRRSGYSVAEEPAEISEPGHGYGFAFRDPEGRIIRILSDDKRHPKEQLQPDRPIKITHVVLNSRSVEAVASFYCNFLGFEIIDRTASMTFIRCNEDHHTLAFAHSDFVTLHHIAFEMEDLDSVMRGAGRMRDNGYELDWGVGRHGPGNNVFAYFVGPDDFVIEYTAEVEKVDRNYRVRGPADWAWPPGRNDQWGIGVGPTKRMMEAQTRIGCSPDVFRPRD